VRTGNPHALAHPSPIAAADLTVVILAIVLASAASAYLGAARARQGQEENLRRVVSELKDAKYPLSKPVLEP